jgi:hypothetical protein
MSSDPALDAAARRLARAHAEVRVFRAGESEAEADADALYWIEFRKMSAPPSSGS